MELYPQKRQLRTYREFVEAINHAIEEHRGSYKKIGAILLKAKTTLTMDDYLALELHLKVQGFTGNKIRACLAATTGDIDESLIFYHEKKTRLVNLPKPDQRTLLEREHELRRQDGTVEHKLWAHMTAAEKIQLVGVACDRIIPAQEQEVKTKGGRRIAYSTAQFANDELLFSLGKRQGKINRGCPDLS
jgi:hypothetical protein